MLLTFPGTHPIPERPPGSPQTPLWEIMFKLFCGDVFNVCKTVRYKNERPAGLRTSCNVHATTQIGMMQIDTGKMTLGI